MEAVDYDKQIAEAAQHVLSVMSERVSFDDLARIKKAYEFAKEAHKLQKRKTGAPYIIHPIAVANIAAEELKLDTNSVITAFLHDVVEDTDYTIEDIRTMFGDDVAMLVDVVTKKKKDHYKMTKQVDNYQQLLDSIHYDIRALMVKIADRLHNMRTLSSMHPVKQMKIAGETDYFYAPLANRLGLYDVKTDLENLSFKYRCPKEFEDISNLVEREKIADKPRLDKLCEDIETTLKISGIWAKAEVYYRRPFSLWRRSKSQERDVKHIDNHYYIRITYSHCEEHLSDKDICLKIYSLLTDIYKEKPGSFNNQIDQQKQNTYQSLNVMLLSQEGVWEDVQICSEHMVEVSKLGCMADLGESNVSEWMEHFKKVLKEIASQNSGQMFIESVVTNLYYDDIMVFTPYGDSVVLPKGASAIDFAFHLHTDIGMHAKYARINGKLCSVRTELHRGDVVEIGTDEKSEMAVENWLDNAVSYKARKAIRSKFAKDPLHNIIRCPHCLPIPGGEVIGMKTDDGKIVIHRKNCPVGIRHASKHGDSIVPIDPEYEDSVGLLFPVTLKVTAVQRSRLLTDIIDTFTSKLYLPIVKMEYTNEDYITHCTITFLVDNIHEYDHAKSCLYDVDGIDEVQHEITNDN